MFKIIQFTNLTKNIKKIEIIIFCIFCTKLKKIYITEQHFHGQLQGQTNKLESTDVESNVNVRTQYLQQLHHTK